MKIGVILSSFRLPPYQALERAAGLGADGVQLWCASGELTAEALAADDRRRLRRRIADLGLEVSALCADFGQSYVRARELEWLVPRTKAAVGLAADMEVDVITTHIGVVPHDRSDHRIDRASRWLRAPG